MALGEAISHIHLLESLGLLKRRFDGEAYLFSSVGAFNSETLMADVDALPGVALRPLDKMLAD